MIEIAIMGLTNKCNISCPNCISGDMRRGPRWDTTPDDIRHMVKRIKESGFSCRTLILAGPGEPTFTPQFEECIRVLCADKFFKRLSIITNGILINEFNDDVWKYFDAIKLTCHEPFDTWDNHIAFMRTHKQAVIHKSVVKIEDHVDEVLSDDVPFIGCTCAAPTFMKDKINLCCGGDIGVAMKYARLNDIEVELPIVSIDTDWINHPLFDNQGVLDMCKFCSANKQTKAYKLYGTELRKTQWCKPIFKNLKQLEEANLI